MASRRTVRYAPFQGMSIPVPLDRLRTAIAERGCHTMTSKGRPPDRGASGANGVGLRNATTTIVRRASAACARKVPVNSRPGTSSRVQITVWGPMIAAARPPHMTQEIARALKAGEAESVAANR